MRFTRTKLFSNVLAADVNQPVRANKAVQIWGSLKDTLKNEGFPVAWDLLTHVELHGNIDEGFQADLWFGLFLMSITRIYVDDDNKVLQFGSNHGKLEY